MSAYLSEEEYSLLQKILEKFGLTVDKANGEIADRVRFFPELAEKYQRLTPREREVFHLLAIGVHAKHIAVELDLMPKTVSVHKNSIFKKLGVKTEIELVKVALGSKVISVEQLMQGLC